MEVSKEPFFKRVWYGAGKALESQSPKAREKCILNLIDTKIIPKLDEGDQAWFDRIRPQVEQFAKAAGIATTVGEVAAVVAAGVGIGKGIKKIPEIPKFVRELRFRGTVKAGEGLPDIVFRWTGKKASNLSPTLEKILKAHVTELPVKTDPSFIQWLNDLGDIYKKNFGSSGMEVFQATMIKMLQNATYGLGTMNNIRMDGAKVMGVRNELSAILNMSLGNHKKEALKKLEDLFFDAYDQVPIVYGKTINKTLNKMIARVMFYRWQHMDLPGFKAILHAGNFYSEIPLETIDKAARKLQWHSQLPIPKFRQILEITGNPLGPMEPDQAGKIMEEIWGPSLPQMQAGEMSATKNPFNWVAEKGIEITKDDVQTLLGTQKERDQARHAVNIAAAEAREQARVQELEKRAAERLASRAAMGPEGAPRIRGTVRQAAKRLEKADARLELHERAQAWRAKEPERQRLAVKAQAEATKKLRQDNWDREAMVMRAKGEMEADLDQRARLKAALEKAQAAQQGLASQQTLAEDIGMEIEDKTVAKLQKEHRLAKQVTNEAADTLRHRERLIKLGSTIDAALAEKNPTLVADIAAKVATLGTNESSASKELATLLVSVSAKPTAYLPLLERLQKASESPNSTEALSAAAALLEKAYNSQKGVKKIDATFSTKFSTLAAFWAQRLGLVGLGNLR